MAVAAPITEDSSTKLLRKLVSNSYDLAFNVGPVVYTNTAFISSTGYDDTAELNNRDLPYATVEEALTVLSGAYPGEAVTVRFIDDVNVGTVDVLDFHTAAGALTLRGHGAVRTVTGTLNCTGDNGTDPDQAGGAGFDITLDAIILGTYDGTGGDGALDNGDAGKGGDVTLKNGASVNTFTSPAGTPAGAGSTARKGYLLDLNGHVILTDENDQPLTDEDGNYLTTGAPPP